MLPICPNCNYSNPLINEKGDFCQVCDGPFIRCSIYFAILPIVEFRPISWLSQDDAIQMIKSNSNSKFSKANVNAKNGEKTGEYSWKMDKKKIMIYLKGK